MQKRSQKIKRTTRAKRYGSGLVYKRTEIDSPDSFDMSKLYYPLVFLSIAGILYLMFFSGVFSANQVDVKGVREVSSDDIRKNVEKKLESQLFRRNIFLFDRDSVTREIKRAYTLKNLKIKKQYPSKLDVDVDEYILELEWLSGGKYYLIDEKGKAVAERSDKKGNIPLIEDKKNVPVEIGKSMVTQDFINFIKYLNQNFSSIQNAKITKMEINESFNEINVYSNLGFYIIFDTARDPAQEIKNVMTALTSKEMSGKKFTYMDMRVKNKVFYK